MTNHAIVSCLAAVVAASVSTVAGGQIMSAMRLVAVALGRAS